MKRAPPSERCSVFCWRLQRLPGELSEIADQKRLSVSRQPFPASYYEAKCVPRSAVTIPWETDKSQGTRTSAACQAEGARFPSRPPRGDHNGTRSWPTG